MVSDADSSAAPYVAMDLLVISPEMSAYEMEREARVARNNVYLEVIYRPVHRMNRFTVLSRCAAVVRCSSVPVYPSLCRPQDRVNAEGSFTGLLALWCLMQR